VDLENVVVGCGFDICLSSIGTSTIFKIGWAHGELESAEVTMSRLLLKHGACLVGHQVNRFRSLSAYK
jgi:hypothetical protein